MLVSQFLPFSMAPGKIWHQDNMPFETYSLPFQCFNSILRNF
jgi:hypothetical protein